jgi:hypothetical protein
VLVSGDVQADAADETGVRTVARARLHGTLDARAPIPIGDLATEFEHVDLAGVAEGRLPASDHSGRLELANDVATPRALRVALDLDGPRVAATTLTSLHATGRVADDDVQFRIIASSRDGSAQVTGSVTPRAQRFDVQGTATEIDLAALTGRPALTGRAKATWQLAGEGFSPATTKTTAALTLAPGRVGGVTIQSGSVVARAEEGRLVIDRATVVTSAGAAEAAGDLILGSDATAHTGGLRGALRATDLRPLATLFGRPDVQGAATLTVSARSSGCARRDGRAFGARPRGLGLARGQRGCGDRGSWPREPRGERRGARNRPRRRARRAPARRRAARRHVARRARIGARRFRSARARGVRPAPADRQRHA